MSNWFPIFLLPFVTLGIPLLWAVSELFRTPRGVRNWDVLNRDGVVASRVTPLPSRSSD